MTNTLYRPKGSLKPTTSVVVTVMVIHILGTTS